MLFSFDGFDRYEIPSLVLTNPNFQELAIIRQPQDLNLKLVYNGTSELTFKVVNKNNKGEPMPYYEDIQKNRLIHVINSNSANNVGWFVIHTISEVNDGFTAYKQVNCVSYEFLLNNRCITFDDDTYKLYNRLNPADTTTLLGKLLDAMPKKVVNNALVPRWSIGTVSTSLWNKYRTFETSSDTSLYAFMMNDLEKAYECIVIFNTENFTIDVLKLDEATFATDISLSFVNVLKSVELQQCDDSVCTCLSVYGGNDFSIHDVNPLGNSLIYNFDYYKSTGWMSSGLVDAITAWEGKIAAQRINNGSNTYAYYMAELVRLKSELSGLQIQLTNAGTDLTTAETKEAAEMPNVTPETIAELARCRALINDLETRLIPNKQGEITGVTNAKNAVVQDCLISNLSNFTLEQQAELNLYILTSSFNNENYIVTDTMTYAEQQELANELYDHGEDTLARNAVPKYTLGIEALNFPFIKDFEHFAQQLRLGCTISAEVRDGFRIEPLLLELDIDYEKPDNFTMTFANKFTLKDVTNIQAILANTAKTTQKVNGDSYIWAKPEKSGMIDDVTKFMSSSLNLTHNAVMASDKNMISIDGSGLLARRWLSGDNISNYLYDGKQLKIIGNGIYLTNNNWQSLVMAIGEITTANGTVYGVNAPVIAGHLFAGNQLIISDTNDNGIYTFKLDADGCQLINCKMTITGGVNNTVTIDPSNESIFAITKGTDSLFVFDSNGDLLIAGKIQAGSTLGNTTVDSNGALKGTKTTGQNTGAAYINDGSYAFRARPTGCSADVFSVDYTGKMIANNAEITGSIKAGSSVGDTTVSTDGNGLTRTIANAGTAYVNSDGYAFKATPVDDDENTVFSVDYKGKLTATGAEIGGAITAGANSSIGGLSTGSRGVGLSKDNATMGGATNAFSAGTGEQVNFTVGYNGKLTAKGADIKGDVYAENLTVENLRVNGTLSTAGGTPLVWYNNGLWLSPWQQGGGASYLTATYEVALRLNGTQWVCYELSITDGIIRSASSLTDTQYIYVDQAFDDWTACNKRIGISITDPRIIANIHNNGASTNLWDLDSTENYTLTVAKVIQGNYSNGYYYPVANGTFTLTIEKATGKILA